MYTIYNSLYYRVRMQISQGYRFKTFRESLGLSQAQIAGEIEITAGAIGLVEKDKSFLKLDNLLKLSELYNLNLDWLITGNGSMFNKPKNTFEIKYEPITVNQFDFGKRLNKVRVQTDMISAELAMLLDIKENRLLDIMNGKNEPTLEEVKKICENFNVTADWLIFGKE